MNKVAELLPCPFCGETVELTQTGRNQLTIKCKSCQIKRVQKVLKYSLDWLEDKMIEAWNKRQPIIDIPGVKELVKEALSAGHEGAIGWVVDGEVIDWQTDQDMKALEDKDE